MQYSGTYEEPDPEPEKTCYCVCTGWWLDQFGNRNTWDHSNTEVDCDQAEESCTSTDNGQSGIDCVIVIQ